MTTSAAGPGVPPGELSRPRKAGRAGGGKVLVATTSRPACAGWSTTAAPLTLPEMLANPYDTYLEFRATRSAFHFLFPGPENSRARHIHASYQMTKRFGPLTTWTFGLLNEIQGLVLLDVPNLASRLARRTPWAFEPQDIVANAVGIGAALQHSCPHGAP